MPQRHILYLSAQQLAAYPWQGGRLGEPTSFQETAEGLTAFRAYLEPRRNDRFYLLVNLADEGFQQDSIPFLRGRDRKALLQRKLGQYFYATNLSLALHLGLEKGRRKDERLLLAGLTNPLPISPWTTLLQSLGAPLVGIYSLPLLTPLLLKQLHPDPEPCLLLTMQDHSLRQSFFDQGQLHFSRLVPLHDSGIHGIGQALAAEAGKMHQYLASQRLVGRNQTLKALALVHPLAVKAVREVCGDSAAVAFQIIGNDEAARRIGLVSPPQDSRCDTLFLHLLATQTPAQQFAAPPLRHDYRVWQLKTGLARGSLLAFLVCLLFAGQQLYEALRLDGETSAIQAEAAIASQRYNDLAKTFPPLPLDNDSLRQVINRYQSLERLPTTPLSFYALLSQAVDSAPQIELETVAWQRGQPASGGGGNGSGLPMPGEQDETALVKGAVPSGPAANPRQVLAVFERFLAALRRNPELQVQVQQQPFDVESGKVLKGSSTSDAAPMSGEPRRFVVQISRKVRG